MTHVEPEDILRRALHAAAESVEPATEGLTQIRARLSTPHPLAVAWLLGAWEAVSQFVMLRLEEALDWLANSLHTALRTADGLLYPAAERLRPLTERLQPVTDRLRPALAWLAAAVAWVRRVIQPTQAGSEERRSRYAWVRPAQPDLAGRIVRFLVELDAWLGRRDAPLGSERQRRHAPPAGIGPQRQERHHAVPVSQLQAAGKGQASSDGHAEAHADAHAVRLVVAASVNAAADDATADDATPLVAATHVRPGAGDLVRLGHPGRARHRRCHHRRPLRLGRDGEPDSVP